MFSFVPLPPLGLSKDYKLKLKVIHKMNETEAVKQLIDENSKLFYLKFTTTKQKHEVKTFTFSTSCKKIMFAIYQNKSATVTYL